jgi:hypothetical protein
MTPRDTESMTWTFQCAPSVRMTHQRTAFASANSAPVTIATAGISGRFSQTNSSAALASTAACSSTIQ